MNSPKWLGWSRVETGQLWSAQRLFSSLSVWAAFLRAVRSSRARREVVPFELVHCPVLPLVFSLQVWLCLLLSQVGCTPSALGRLQDQQPPVRTAWRALRTIQPSRDSDHLSAQLTDNGFTDKAQAAAPHSAGLRVLILAFRSCRDC